MARRAIRWTFGLAAAWLMLRGLALFHGLEGERLYDGDRDAQMALARGVDRWVDAPLDRESFPTGSSRFDGEWLFATRMMAALGYAQVALEHPEQRAAMRPRIDRALASLVDQRTRAFDREAWGHDPIDDLGSDRPHVAYLGYLVLAISVAREADPETRFGELGDRIVRHLSRLFEASETGLLESYPNEVYPIDNTAFFGALGLRVRAGDGHSALLGHLLDGLGRYRHPRSGLLYQSVDPDDGAPIDLARGSGTALAAYYLSFGDAALSRSLYASIQQHLLRSYAGFGVTREHQPGEGGFGDVDSGPVIFGAGVSATGFTLAAARAHGDRETFVRTFATASLVGGPVGEDRHFALGGPIGDALLFALTTARPAERWR